MHTSEEEMILQHLARPRWLATATYVMALCASLVFIFIPSSSIREGWGFFIQLAFHLFLGIGASISMIGAYTKRSAVEAMGTPLVITAVFAYGVLLFLSAASGESDAPGAATGVGFLMMTLALGLGGRLWECIKRMNTSVALYDRSHE